MSEHPYYDQTTSPLGRSRHCDLVRNGVIRGWKVGRRWLARREDVEAWIESERSVRPESPLLPKAEDRLKRAGLD